MKTSSAMFREAVFRYQRLDQCLCRQGLVSGPGAAGAGVAWWNTGDTRNQRLCASAGVGVKSVPSRASFPCVAGAGHLPQPLEPGERFGGDHLVLAWSGQ